MARKSIRYGLARVRAEEWRKVAKKRDSKAAKAVLVIGPKEIAKVITRLAAEIIESNPDIENLAIAGIVSRGEAIAARIVKSIKRKTGVAVPTGHVDVTFYRDDYRDSGAKLAAKSTKIDFAVTGKTIVLVDDVMFTGRTVRAAIEAILQFGRPKRIQFAALIDRGHRELPISPDFVGKIIKTDPGDTVKLALKDAGGAEEDSVYHLPGGGKEGK